MRSIPLAMTWELFRRSPWMLIGGALAGNALPMLILAALQREGGVDPNDPSMLIMHLVMVQINMLVFASGLFTSQGSPSRLYALPITTPTLVTWHLLPAMVLMTLQSVASTAALNAAFHLNWPLWGPALFAAVAFACVEAVLWLTEKSGWIFIGLTLVASTLGLWLKSRYGSTFSQPVHHWSEVTPAELLTLGVAAGLAWFLGVVAIARNRRGDRLPELGLIAWLNRVLDPAPAYGQPFRTPAQAQKWFEWRKKGWAMPAIVLFAMTMGAGGWLTFSRNPTELVEGFIFGGGMLSAAALVVGLMTGNLSRDDANFDIGQFLATRPMTNTDLARTILKSAAQSVFLGWAIWAVATLVLYAALVPTGLITVPNSLKDLPWWYYPATLLGPWMIVGVGTAIGLSGRMKEFVIVFCCLFVLWIGGMVATGYAVSTGALSELAVAELAQGIWCAIGATFVIATAWAFAAAHRRALIGQPTVAAAASVWAALTTIVIFASVLYPKETLPAILFMIGALALTVFPLAAAPLALSWNRTR